ncbi:MAG TPA: hypothetical protein VLF89_10200 [Candidatus Saccharimonadales bacterium]|nr:hypothetical protein [Candidatus Saccharimonadales bacterium]
MAKKIVTKKQHVILLLLYLFRFINSKQIQEFLGHADHRRSNGWLKDLVDKEYIERDYTVVYGILTKPAVYSLSAKGRKHIKDSYQYFFPNYMKRIARDPKASKAFRIKCQIVADWYLFELQNLRQKQASRTIIPMIDDLVKILTTDTNEEKIPFNTVQFFTPALFPSFILLEKLKPDGYIRRRTKSGIGHGFIFIIDAYIPRFLLRYTIKRIFDTLDEEYWEDESIDALHLYFLCPNNQIIIYMKKLLTQPLRGYYYKTPLYIRFATRNQFYNRKNGKTDKMGWKIVSSSDY